MKKILLLFFVLLMAIAFMSGCFKDKDDIESKTEDKTNSENQVDKSVNKRVSESGIYVGQIDNNFIEINVSNKPISFMLTDESKKLIEKIDENEKVDFVYFKNQKNQFVLVSITKTDSSEETFKTDTGTYVGQIDNFSIEVQIEGTPKAFMNYEMDKLLKDIDEGDEVELQYTENEQGQLNLKSIRKID